MGRGEEVRGSMGVGCRGEAGGVRGWGVEGVQVGVKIGCHVVGRGRVLCI